MLPCYRPDAVVDPEFEGFAANLVALGTLTGEDTMTWAGYLAAHRKRRAFFKQMGATATDHGHATARTANLDITRRAASSRKSPGARRRTRKPISSAARC